MSTKKRKSSTFCRLSDWKTVPHSLTHVHHEGEGFQITSDFAIEDLFSCEVVETDLFGGMARYFYPKDAVLELVDFKGKPSDALQSMRQIWKEKCEEDCFQDDLYHITIKLDTESLHSIEREEEVEEEEDEEAEEEEYSGEEEEEEEDKEDENLWGSDDELPISEKEEGKKCS